MRGGRPMVGPAVTRGPVPSKGTVGTPWHSSGLDESARGAPAQRGLGGWLTGGEAASVLAEPLGLSATGTATFTDVAGTRHEPGIAAMTSSA